MRGLAALIAVAALNMAGRAAADPAPLRACKTILPPEQVLAGVRRLQPEDIVRLRDIGPIDPEPWAAPFLAISPDGSEVAFQLRQADPASNGYCLAMAVIELVPGARPRIVDEGGDLLLLTIDNRGLADYPTGITSAVTPRWSPDGRWIAFLKRSGDTTQVWRAMADGSGSGPVTHSAVDVVDFPDRRRRAGDRLCNPAGIRQGARGAEGRGPLGLSFRRPVLALRKRQAICARAGRAGSVGPRTRKRASAKGERRGSGADSG
jgi:hypothetical protein